MNRKILAENIESRLRFFSFKSRTFLTPSSEPVDNFIVLESFLRVLLFAFFFLFLSSLIALQIFEGSYNLSLSQFNSLQKVPLKAERGLIVGLGGKVLAGNSPSFDLYFNPRLCPQSKCNLDLLKEYNFYSQDTERLLREAKETVVIRDIGQVAALSLLSKLTEGKADLAYLEVRAGQKRDYKTSRPEAFFHLLGYVSPVSQEDLKRHRGLKLDDRVGQIGVEKVYEEFLRGRDGGEIFEANARGEVLRKVRSVPAQPGRTVVLNIDEDLQEASFKFLEEAVKNSGAKGGAVVAQEPQSGKVLALVSYPSLDGNIFSRPLKAQEFSELENDESKPFFNRSVSGAFPPGSIFKLVVAVGALAQKIITAQTVIESRGVINIGEFTFRDWRPEGHGNIRLPDAIRVSCDTCFYIIGGGYGSQKGLGEQETAHFARLFGMGSTLGIDIPGEVGGLVPSAAWKKKVKGEIWYIGDTYHYAIGQGFILTTPLQINSLTATIANGGTVYLPYLVAQIKDSQGNLLRSFGKKVLRENFVEPDYLNVIKEGLAKAAQPGGTAYPFFDFPVPVAGKTGTAETGRGTTHAWFTVFAPVNDAKIALTVFLEEGGEGSRDAAPLARKILQEYFNL